MISIYVRLRKIRGWIAAGVVGALLILGITISLSREPGLLDRAKRVSSMPNMQGASYFWLSDGAFAFCEPGIATSLRPTGDWRRRDILTNQETPLVSTTDFALPVVPSPDGRWLMWISRQGVIRKLHLAALDGTRSLEKNTDASCVAWLPDSRGYAALHAERGKATLETSALDGLDRSRRQSFPATDPIQTMWPASNGAVVTADHLFRVSYDEGFLLMSGTHIFEIDLKGKSPAAQLRSNNGVYGLNSVEFSPDGRRIAVVTRSRHTPAFLSALSRFLPSLKPGYTVFESLSVYDIETGVEHLVGSEDKPGAGDIQAVRWLPDGKRLSFVYQSALYTAPVPSAESPR